MIMVGSNPSGITPLQRVLGFEVAEEIYDTLDMREQLIIDLKIAGWSQHDIGEALGLSQGWVSILFRRTRYNLANSKLLQSIEIRQHMREHTPSIHIDESNHQSDG